MAARPKSQLDAHRAGVQEILNVVTGRQHMAYRFVAQETLRARILARFAAGKGSLVTEGYLEVIHRPAPNIPKGCFVGLRLKNGQFIGLPCTTAELFVSDTAVQNERGDAYLLVPGKNDAWTVEKFSFGLKRQPNAPGSHELLGIG